MVLFLLMDDREKNIDDGEKNIDDGEKMLRVIAVQIKPSYIEYA